MFRMNICPDTPMVFIIETYPQTMQLFKSIGMCCVHEGNMNCSVEQICAEYGVDTGSFIEGLNRSVKELDK